MANQSYLAFKKYLKFFSVRFVQALIQSRLGDEVESKCMAFSENSQDWFNMKIDELGEISAYLKSNIKNYPPTGTLTLEFLLYTPSGQCLPLEAWVLSCSEKPEREGSGYNLNELYHHMSTLLRSTIVSSRMTPMHRLYVKKQDQESFVIMYRVFENDISSDMGKGKKSRKIGELVSQFGTISLDLHYRTSMHFEEPEFAPEIPLEEDQENIEDCEKTIVEENTPKRAVSECVPIADVKKRTASGSVESPNSGGSSISREAAPRFILGQSTSSEESRHSEIPHSYDEDRRPSLADLRNHSFPFVNLLQSAYNPANGTKKNSSSNSLKETPKPVPEDGKKAEKTIESGNLESEAKIPVESTEKIKSPTPTPIIEKVAESFRAAKIDEEDEDEEQPVEGMELSEDSFVHFNPLSEFGGAPSSGNELGDLLKSLKTAPEMFQMGEIDITAVDLKTELEKISAQTANFTHFLQHVNSFSDE